MRWMKLSMTTFGLSAFVALLSLAVATQEMKNADGLCQKAEETGPVRVIVTLDVPDLPQGRAPTENELEVRRRTIAERKATLLSRTGASNVMVLRTYDLVPLITLEVDGDALCALRQAKEVVSISEDVVVPVLRREREFD